MSVDGARFAAILDRIESLLSSVGDPLVSAFRPGLTPAEIDRVMEPLGLQLPVEARMWWGWHDGVAGPGPDLFGIGRPFTLSEAVDEYFVRRDRYAVEAAEIDEDPNRSRSWFWEDSWLPFAQTGHAGVITIEMGIAEGEGTPVRDSEIDPDGEFRTPRAGSLTEYLEARIVAIDAGIYGWHSDKSRWDYTVEWRDIPADLRRRLAR